MTADEPGATLRGVLSWQDRDARVAPGAFAGQVGKVVPVTAEQERDRLDALGGVREERDATPDEGEIDWKAHAEAQIAALNGDLGPMRERLAKSDPGLLDPAPVVPDSPRWCRTCQCYGDHHTDGHPPEAVPDSPDVLRVAADAWEDVERADSPDVRERVVMALANMTPEQWALSSDPGRRYMVEHHGPAADRVLAVVGQGVTAGERRYSVGDPDPTPDGSENLCEAQRDGLVCTWPADHDHPQHVAGAGDEIVAVWDVRSGEQEG